MKAKKRYAGFVLFPNDWAARIQGLSPAATNAAFRLSLAMWSQSPDGCSLPDNDVGPARIIGISVEEWRTIRTELQDPAQPFFKVRKRRDGGRLVSPLLEAAQEQVEKHREASSKGGTRSAAEAAAKKADMKKQFSTAFEEKEEANEEGEEKIVESIASEARGLQGALNGSSRVAQVNSTNPILSDPILINPIQSESKKEKKDTVSSSLNPEADKTKTALNGYQAGFDRFWAAYPEHKRVKKVEAMAVWHQLAPNAELVDIIVNKVDQFKHTEECQRENGRYVPHPVKWLSGKRWTDTCVNPFGTCQSRVERGLRLEPCGAPAVRKIGTRSVCAAHNKREPAL